MSDLLETAEAFWFNKAFRAYEMLEELSPNDQFLKPENAAKLMRRNGTRTGGFCEYAQALTRAIGKLRYR